MEGNSMKTSLSSAWAIHQALRAAGVDSIPEDLVFGLGASAWYHLAPTVPGSPSHVLRFASQNRIGRTFDALNIYAGCYNILSREAYGHLCSGLRDGGRALVVGDRFALPSNEIRDGSDCCLDFALLATPAENSDGSSGIALQGPGDHGPWKIDREEFERAWFYLRGSASSATFFWYHVMKVNWVPELAIPFALQRYILQMSASHPSLGVTGLRALARLADQVEAGDVAALYRTARCAQADGGLSLCRDMQAGFLREAAQRLARPILAAPADLFDTCGALWRTLMEDCVARSVKPEPAAGLLRQIMKTEAAAISALMSLLNQVDRREPLCHP